MGGVQVLGTLIIGGGVVSWELNFGSGFDLRCY